MMRSQLFAAASPPAQGMTAEEDRSADSPSAAASPGPCARPGWLRWRCSMTPSTTAVGAPGAFLRATERWPGSVGERVPGAGEAGGGAEKETRCRQTRGGGGRGGGGGAPLSHLSRALSSPSSAVSASTDVSSSLAAASPPAPAGTYWLMKGAIAGHASCISTERNQLPARR